MRAPGAEQPIKNEGKRLKLSDDRLKALKRPKVSAEHVERQFIQTQTIGVMNTPECGTHNYIISIPTQRA